MAGIDKSEILVGTDPETGAKALEVYRTLLRVAAFAKEEIIQVWYYEYYLVNGMEVEVTPEKYYVLKDLVVGDIVMEGFIVEQDYNGFTDSIGKSLKEMLEDKNLLADSIPMGAVNGYIKLS